MVNETNIANDLISWAVGLPSIGVVIAYGISIIRRRAAADQKVFHEDKSYNDMLDTYKRERDLTREERDRVIDRMSIVEKERNEAVGKVGKLTAEVEFLSVQVSELKELVSKLGISLENARTDLHKFAIENAKLAAHVSYLDEIIKKDEIPPAKGAAE